ncbi:hypothetical protein DENSPDRAFT_885196 [Dentipellis sp. KUC8613]|nr:hypothetical protein DENSPDRAFT_885196 [Dentipellis sp. KUC8613]
MPCARRALPLHILHRLLTPSAASGRPPRHPRHVCTAHRLRTLLHAASARPSALHVLSTPCVCCLPPPHVIHCLLPLSAPFAASACHLPPLHAARHLRTPSAPSARDQRPLHAARRLRMLHAALARPLAPQHRPNTALAPLNAALTHPSAAPVPPSHAEPLPSRAVALTAALTRPTAAFMPTFTHPGPLSFAPSNPTPSLPPSQPPQLPSSPARVLSHPTPSFFVLSALTQPTAAFMHPGTPSPTLSSPARCLSCPTAALAPPHDLCCTLQQLSPPSPTTAALARLTAALTRALAPTSILALPPPFSCAPPPPSLVHCRPREPPAAVRCSRTLTAALSRPNAALLRLAALLACPLVLSRAPRARPFALLFPPSRRRRATLTPSPCHPH